MGAFDKMLGPSLLLLCLLAASSTFGIPSPSLPPNGRSPIPGPRKDGFSSTTSQLYEVDDMLLTEEQVPSALREKFCLKNDSAAFEDGVIASPGRKDEWYRWPERVLTYEFHSSISFDNRNKIKNALQGLEDKLDSCVKFSEANSGPRVVIFDDTNCYSVVGYQHRVQGLSLGSRGCMSNSTIEHEFLHALGVWHTQSRTDRDSYVKILEDNIRPDRLNNFEIADKNEASEFDLPYDYYSVMHYGAYDFSNHKPDEPWKITIE